MPGPIVLLGLGFLGSVLGKLFTSLVEVLAKYFTKKVAVRLLAVSAIVVIFGLFVGAIEAVIAGLSFALPQEFAAMIAYIVPWNASTCISAVLTAKIARHVYDANVKWVQWSLPGI